MNKRKRNVLDDSLAKLAKRVSDLEMEVVDLGLAYPDSSGQLVSRHGRHQSKRSQQIRRNVRERKAVPFGELLVLIYLFMLVMAL